MRMRTHAGLCIAISTALLLGCAEDDRSSGANAQPSQVIARVNGEEISLLQYRRALRLARVSSPSESVRQEITEKLIDRELAVQQARQLGLDRRPEVLIELEEARRDVLARAWANQLASQARNPDERAAAAYYADHPHLFAKRRIYHLREAVVARDAAQFDEFRARLLGGDSPADSLAWLQEQGFEFKSQVVVRTAEQLPIEALPRLATTAAGKAAYFETPRGLMVYEVIESRSAPFDWKTARPAILAHLSKQAGKEAVAAEKLRLRQAADIQQPSSSPSPASANRQASR